MARANGFLKFTETFPNEQSCLKYLEELRWKGKVVSPFDETSKVYKCRNGKYKCSKTGKYFDNKKKADNKKEPKKRANRK